MIVVGSGPAGVMAARELRPLSILMLDVGHQAGDLNLPDCDLHDLRLERDLTPFLIGERFEGLHNIEGSYLSPKLKSPLMRFITDLPKGVDPPIRNGFAAVTSHARGGLANAWGAGVFRYDDNDLAGYPVTAAELAPYYDDLTRHIGVSGTDDDLTPFFGSTADLQPPLPLSRLAATLLRRYERRRRRFQRHGIRFGRLRSAILTREHDGRPAHKTHNQEFFQPNIRSVYHPGYTLDTLIQGQELAYAPGYLVLAYRESADAVEVSARHLPTGRLEQFSARHLVLAAGALGSAQIALASDNDTDTRLPILDNLLSYVPLVDLARIGDPLDVHSFSGAELCMVYEGPLSPQRIQASFYGLVAPLKGDLFGDLPLTVRGNLVALKYLLPAMGMLQVFYPDRPAASNWVRLSAEGRLEVRYQRREFGILERHLITRLLRAGYLSLPRLCQYPEPGSSMHYAGTLPMRAEPAGRYETDRYGLLAGSRRVRVADGAALPVLPSKNHTFTIMANAMRVARALKEGSPG